MDWNPKPHGQWRGNRSLLRTRSSMFELDFWGCICKNNKFCKLLFCLSLVIKPVISKKSKVHLSIYIFMQKENNEEEEEMQLLDSHELIWRIEPLLNCEVIYFGNWSPPHVSCSFFFLTTQHCHYQSITIIRS